MISGAMLQLGPWVVPCLIVLAGVLAYLGIRMIFQKWWPHLW